MLDIDEHDSLYTSLPLFHTNALNTVIQALVTGARVTVGPRFSASRFWERLVESDATVTYILGAMATIIASRDPSPLEREHTVRVALAPAIPVAVHEIFRDRFGIKLIEGHGMTETNFTIGPLDGEQRPGTMGRVLPGGGNAGARSSQGLTVGQAVELVDADGVPIASPARVG